MDDEYEVFNVIDEYDTLPMIAVKADSISTVYVDKKRLAALSMFCEWQAHSIYRKRIPISFYTLLHAIGIGVASGITNVLHEQRHCRMYSKMSDVCLRVRE